MSKPPVTYGDIWQWDFNGTPTETSVMGNTSGPQGVHSPAKDDEKGKKQGFGNKRKSKRKSKRKTKSKKTRRQKSKTIKRRYKRSKSRL